MGGDSIPMRNFRCGAPWRQCTDGISQKISAGMGLQACIRVILVPDDPRGLLPLPYEGRGRGP